MSQMSVPERIADPSSGAVPLSIGDNPVLRHAKLLEGIEAVYWTVRRVSFAQNPWADRIGAAVCGDDLSVDLSAMERLVVLDADWHKYPASRSA